MKTSWEKVTVDTSPMGMYLAEPEGPGPFPAVIVIQNKDGVKEFTQEMTRRVAEARYVAIAPQLYHREGEPKTPEETDNLRHARRDTNVINDLNATINFLRGCANVDTSRLGIVGFCMAGASRFSRLPRPRPSMPPSISTVAAFIQNGALTVPHRRTSRPMYHARSKVTSASSIPIRRRMRCACSTQS
jgi:dienelactone hydrolase